MRNKAWDQCPGPATHVVWLGDFNTHHPMWDKDRNLHLFTQANLDKAQLVIDAMANYDLQMLLPKDIPTLCTMASWNYTCLDNVPESSSLHELVIEWQTISEECPPRMDHMPIITTLKMSPGRQVAVPKPNFKLTNWPNLRKELTKKLVNIDPQKKVWSECEFYSRFNALTAAITDTNWSGSPEDKPITIHQMLVVKRTLTEMHGST